MKQEVIEDFDLKDTTQAAALEEYINIAKDKILTIPSSEYDRSVTILDFPSSLDDFSFELNRELKVPVSRIPDLILSWGAGRIESRIDNKLTKKIELLSSIKNYVQIGRQSSTPFSDFHPVFGNQQTAKRVFKIRESTYNKIILLRSSLFCQSSNLCLSAYLISLVDSETSLKIKWFGEIRPQIELIIRKSIEARNNFYLHVFKHIQNDLFLTYTDENNSKKLVTKDYDAIVVALKQFRMFKIKSVNINYERLKMNKEWSDGAEYETEGENVSPDTAI